MWKSQFQFMVGEGGIFHYQQAAVRHQHSVQEFNSILTLYTQRQHQISQVKSSTLQILLLTPAPPQL